MNKYFFNSTRKISSIGEFLHNSFAGRSLETLGLENVGALMFHNPMGLYGLLQG
jgi:hypothetical protein